MSNLDQKFDQISNDIDDFINGKPLFFLGVIVAGLIYFFHDTIYYRLQAVFIANRGNIRLVFQFILALLAIYIVKSVVNLLFSKYRFSYIRLLPSTNSKAKVNDYILLTRSFYSIPMPYYLRFLIGKKRFSFIVSKDSEGEASFYVGSDKYFLPQLQSLFSNHFAEMQVHSADSLIFPNEQRKLPFGFSVFSKHLKSYAYRKANNDILGNIAVQLPNLSVMQVSFTNYSLRKFRKRVNKLEKDVFNSPEKVTHRTSDKKELLKDSAKRFESDEVVYRAILGFSGIGVDTKTSLFSAFNTLSTALNDRNKIKRFRNRFATSRFQWFGFPLKLTGSELANIVHLPMLSADKTSEIILETIPHVSDNLNQLQKGVMSDPKDIKLGMLDDPVIENRSVYIQRKFLGEHFGCFGGTGSGKSTILNAILKNGFFDPFIESAENDNTVGCTFLDPAQDTVKTFLNYLLAREAKGATIHWDKIHYFKIANSEYPLPMNILKKIQGVSIEAQADAITHIIDNVFDNKAEVASRLLRFCIYTLLADTDTIHTILEVNKLLDDPAFRSTILVRISHNDPAKFYEVLNYWNTDAEDNMKTSGTAVKNRIDIFSNSESMRLIFGQQDNQLFAKDYMDKGHFVFFDLSNLNERESTIISSYISYLYYRTVETRPVGSNLHMLIVDEAHRIGNIPILPSIVAESRKFGLGLGITTQRLKQLPYELQGALRNIQSNFFICRQGSEDSKTAVENIGRNYVTQGTLEQLKPRHAVVKYPFEFKDGSRETEIFSVKVDPLDKFDQEGNVIPFSDSNEYQLAVEKVNKWTLERIESLMKNRGYDNKNTVQQKIFEHLSQGFESRKNEQENEESDNVFSSDSFF